MARAKTKKTAAAVTTTVGAPTVNAVLNDFNNNGVDLSESVGQMVPISQFDPSPTNPRKRFPDESIAELAGSIREQGVIEPLIVRQTGPIEWDGDSKYNSRFEIVCGERRYRASVIAGLEKLPCIVRDLTDDQVLDIQIHENLHREDVHPMDEAYGYKFLQDKLNCTVAELSLRVGKSEGYILNRLKLNSLIDEAQKDIEDGHLPLVYALEVAKYSPDAQNLIYPRLYRTQWSGSKQIPDKSKPQPFRELVEWIETNILWRLAKAPFSIKAADLRADGLACINCPDRTGANATLFGEENIGKKDACLNPTCFRAKANAFVLLTRQKMADDGGVKLKQIPFVRSDRYSSDIKDDFLNYHQFEIVKPKEKACGHSQKAISIADDTFGKIVDICPKSSNCKTHHSRYGNEPKKVADMSEDEREKSLIEKRKRREELFDVKVGNTTRVRVFKNAAEIFAQQYTFEYAGHEFLPALIGKLWGMSNNGDDANTLSNVVLEILKQWDEKLGETSIRSWGSEGNTALLKAFPVDILRRLLFLFVQGNKGGMYYDRWASQGEVKELAVEYEIDYQLIDAEERLGHAPMKSKDLFRKYLADIEAGNREVKTPRMFTDKYKAKD